MRNRTGSSWSAGFSAAIRSARPACRRGRCHCWSTPNLCGRRSVWAHRTRHGTVVFCGIRENAQLAGEPLVHLHLLEQDVPYMFLIAEVQVRLLLFVAAATPTKSCLLDATCVAPGRRVLDVATGPGVAAAAMRSRGAVVVGVDVSPGMIALAQRIQPDIEFQVSDAAALSFREASFDAVVCNFAIGHFPEPEVALAECARVLAPGGRLAFSW